MIYIAVRINSNDNSFCVTFSFKYKLLRHCKKISVTSVTQCLAFLFRICKSRYPISKFIMFRLFYCRTQCIVAITFFSCNSPLTSIINAGHSRHAKQKTIYRKKIIFIFKNTCNSCNIMIVNKRKQMFSTVYAPLFISKLSVKAICYFMHV